MKIEDRFAKCYGDYTDEHHNNYAIILDIANSLRSVDVNAVGIIWTNYKHTISIYFTTKPELWEIGPYKVAIYNVMESCELVLTADFKRLNICINKNYPDPIAADSEFIFSIECPNSIKLVIDCIKKSIIELDSSTTIDQEITDG